MISALGRWWRWYQRKTDLAILWPECKRQCDGIDQAKAVFMFHCMEDPAWTGDFDERDIAWLVDTLD